MELTTQLSHKGQKGNADDQCTICLSDCWLMISSKAFPLYWPGISLSVRLWPWLYLPWQVGVHLFLLCTDAGVIHSKSVTGNLEFSCVSYPTFSSLPPFTKSLNLEREALLTSHLRPCASADFNCAYHSPAALIGEPGTLTSFDKLKISGQAWSWKSHCLNQIVLSSNTPLTLTNSVFFYLALALYWHFIPIAFIKIMGGIKTTNAYFIMLVLRLSFC